MFYVFLTNFSDWCFFSLVFIPCSVTFPWLPHPIPGHRDGLINWMNLIIVPTHTTVCPKVGGMTRAELIRVHLEQEEKWPSFCGQGTEKTKKQASGRPSFLPFGKSLSAVRENGAKIEWKLGVGKENPGALNLDSNPWSLGFCSFSLPLWALLKHPFLLQKLINSLFGLSHLELGFKHLQPKF